MRKLLAVLVVLPLAALAQGRGPGPGPGGGQGAQAGAQAPGPRGDPERMERRMRLTRTLGLAEALDLEPEQALKLGQQVGKFDDRRLALHKQLHDAHQVLRRAAQGEKVSAGEVDQAIKTALDARAQMQAIDRDVVATVTKDLSPEKRARAVLFLERFQGRFGPGMGPGMMKFRRGGPGPGKGMGMGMGPGMGMMHGPGPGCLGLADDDDEE
ncbi:periplasmic heavy metal sensor [Anaeromyxobacter sp. Red801]|uniref:periplasmic heavy metal sensor n=1 Tax=Anaeromyxobacter sp. Red801 TaxID=3411632 RepID=UPI003B9EA26E